MVKKTKKKAKNAKLNTKQDKKQPNKPNSNTKVAMQEPKETKVNAKADKAVAQKPKLNTKAVKEEPQKPIINTTVVNKAVPKIMKLNTKESLTDLLSVESHLNSGIYIVRGKHDTIQLATRSLSHAPLKGETHFNNDFMGTRTHFCIWSPFQCKLAAAIMNGLDNLNIKPQSKLLYLGANYGVTAPRMCDIVGEAGLVYIVEQKLRAGNEVLKLAERRTNIVPIIEDATMPYKYRMLIMEVIDTIYCDLPRAECVRTLLLNARHYLKNGGHFIMVTRQEQTKDCMYLLKAEKFGQFKQIPLDPFFKGYTMLLGASFRGSTEGESDPSSYPDSSVDQDSYPD